jgi:hypothetical protein
MFHLSRLGIKTKPLKRKTNNHPTYTQLIKWKLSLNRQE